MKPALLLGRALQRLAPAQVIEPLPAGRAAFGHLQRAERLTELVTDSRWLNRVPAYSIGYGALRERPPAESIRSGCVVREAS